MMSNAFNLLMSIPCDIDGKIRLGAERYWLKRKVSGQEDAFMGVSAPVAGAVTRIAHEAILVEVGDEYSVPVFRWGDVADNGSVLE